MLLYSPQRAALRCRPALMRSAKPVGRVTRLWLSYLMLLVLFHSGCCIFALDVGEPEGVSPRTSDERLSSG